MIACDLVISESRSVDVQSAGDPAERCKQWVLNESGQCPSEVASWDGSVNYESQGGCGRLDSCSAYAGLLDSCRSPIGLVPRKPIPNLESWNSSRSPPMCHAQVCAKPELAIYPSDFNEIEVPQASSSTDTKLEI